MLLFLLSLQIVQTLGWMMRPSVRVVGPGQSFSRALPGSRPFSLKTCSMAMATPEAPETFSFESNVARVMDIIINSLYSNKDVFLRELISNAADACDKKRFLSLTDNSNQELAIRVYANRDANTLTIADSGIGMNRQDLIQNLGRIAESGTKRFTEAVNKTNAVNLIGQFGVGFYSGFLVADRISVQSRGSEGEQNKWEATAATLDKYTITPETPSINGTGTVITLHLKDEVDEYLDDQNLQVRALVSYCGDCVRGLHSERR